MIQNKKRTAEEIVNAMPRHDVRDAAKRNKIASDILANGWRDGSIIVAVTDGDEVVQLLTGTHRQAALDTLLRAEEIDSELEVSTCEIDYSDLAKFLDGRDFFSVDNDTIADFLGGEVAEIIYSEGE